jgi:tetratricopeptide (TPR) repeat protein
VISGQGTTAQAWLDRATAHLRAGRWTEAEECARRAVSMAPNDPASILTLGQSLLALGRRGDAYAAALRVASLQPREAELNDAVGTLLTHCDDALRAVPFFERAVARAPARTDYLYNLAAAQRMTGDVAGAESSLDRAIAAAPGDVQAHYMRADLRTQSVESNHVGEMKRLMDRGRFTDPRSEVMLCFALAKELEDLERYDESFSYLRRGCDLQRRMMAYNVLDDVATIDRIVQLHDSAMISRTSGTEGHQAIFVIGLPRSGTTLVEQILGSHCGVHAAGELQAFPLETLKAVGRACGRPVGKLEFVERSREIEPNELGRAYLEAAGCRHFQKARFVDKQPLNYLYAGLIARALPGARFIAVAREPMDSCYAMYKALFTNAYPFSYDLHDLARYYTAWHALLRHWQAVLGDRLLTVQYEDLVADQETVTRRILAHCGLGWEAACLEFHQRRGAVSSASAVQVRRPLYSHSVGKWRHFERQLTPLAAHFTQHEPAGGWRLATPPSG